MNRARRIVTLKRKTPKQVSDDDFESGDGFSDDPDDDDDDGDFSASEEEWLPGKEKGGSKEDEETQETSDGEDDDDEDESENPEDDLEEDSDESVVATGGSKTKKRTSKTSVNPIPKKKRLSAATRDELYQRTKKYLLKETDPERPSLNSSVADILKQCQFQKKKDINDSAKTGSSPRVEQVQQKKKVAGDDSDSSGDDHLMKPEELDLGSKFFDKIEPQKQEQTAVPQFDCNAGMRLSDSSDEDDDEREEAVPASIQKVAAQQLISKINESSCDFMNFNSLGEFNKKIEEAKNMLKNYQAKEGGQVERSQEKKPEDVSNLLALGETEAGISPGKDDAAGHHETGSEESDWEEVEDAKRSQLTQKPPEDDYQVTVEVQTEKSRKKRWEEIEMELFIKRQINKVKRANQLAFHKSSVLCAIAGGKKLNEIVNSPGIQARALSLMQSGQCELKGKLDGKFVDQLMKWFKNKFELTSQQIYGPKESRVRFTLALELFTRKVVCKRDYVLLFLACLRAAGVDCRLIISANVPPKRPAMKDLCPISERQLLDKFEKEFGKQSILKINRDPDGTKDVQDVKVEVEVKGENAVEEADVSTKPAKATIKRKIEGNNILTVEEAADEHVDNEQMSSEADVPRKPTKATIKRKIKEEVEVKSSQSVEEAIEEHLNDEQVSSEADLPRKSARVTTKRESTQKTHGEGERRGTRSTQAARSSRLSLPKVQVLEEPDKELRRGRSLNKSTQRTQRDSSTDSSRKIRFSPEPEICDGQSRSTSTSPAKENARPRKSILKTSSPRVTRRMPLNSLIVPQLDGISDLVLSTPQSLPVSRRLRSRTKSTAAESSSPFTKRATNTPTMAKEKNNNQPGRISKRKLFDVSKTMASTTTTKEDAVPLPPTTVKPKSAKNKILSSDSSDEDAKPSPAPNKKRQTRVKPKRPPPPPQSSYSSDDSDFEPPGKKKAKRTATKGKSESPGKHSSKAAAASKKKSKSAAAAKDVEKEHSELTSGSKMDLC